MIKTAIHKVSQQLHPARLYSPSGAVFHAVFAILLAFLTVAIGYIVGPLLVGILSGFIILFISLRYPLIGFYVVTTISFVAFFPERIVGAPLPLSTGIEILVFCLYMGIALQRNPKEDDRLFYKSPSSIAIFMYFLLFVIEAFNPNMYSVEGWIFYMHRYIMFTLIYYIAYRLLDDINKIKFYMKFWIVIALVNALYTCKQQWFGFAGFEYNWLMSNPHLVALYFQGGTFRKFSFLSDPASNGILCGVMCVFTLVLGLGHTVKRRRYQLFTAAFIFFLAMGYTGTRTANIIIVAGALLYVIMTMNHKRTFIVLGIFITIGTFIAYVPTENETINRMRSTFRVSQEESLNIRDVNRKSIQPYIYDHPLGGGLATSSQEGMKYNPGHPLAGFPPDSGLLKTAIETGWIGYTFAMIYYYLIIFQGIHNYFKVRSREIRSYILAITVSLLGFIVTQYSQVSIGQVPGIFFFYPGMALFTRLLMIDSKTLITKPKILV